MLNIACLVVCMCVSTWGLSAPLLAGNKVAGEHNVVPCYNQEEYSIIDVRELAKEFYGKNITSHDGRHIYFISLCSPIACSFKNPESPDAAEAVCQYDTKTDTFYTLGKFTDYYWQGVNKTYYYIVFSGGDRVYPLRPETERHAKIGFNVDGSKTPRIEITSVQLSAVGAPTYVFNVYYGG